MATTKLKTYLGFAIKSNAVLFGTDLIITARRKPCLVVYDVTLAENSLKKLKAYCDNSNVKMCSISGLSALTSRTNTLAVGIKNINLASAMIGEMEKETVNEYGKSE